jgi:hypothetical protein
LVSYSALSNGRSKADHEFVVAVSMEEEMKATVLRFTAVLAVVMAFTAVSAYGQGIVKRQTFVVPFEFSVGQKVLPAGEYTVTGETQILRIQSKDGKEHVIALPLRTRVSAQWPRESKLMFKRYGDRYYLSQVWLPDGIGREFRKQRNAEVDVARNGSTTEILASAR